MKKADVLYCNLNANDRYTMANLMNHIFDDCKKDKNVVLYAKSSYFNSCRMTANDVLDFLAKA